MEERSKTYDLINYAEDMEDIFQSQIQEIMTNRSSYGKIDQSPSWAVLTDQDIVMSAGFISKEEAEDFIQNAYGGYYQGCHAKLVQLHL